MSVRQNSFDSLKKFKENTDQMVEDANNYENLSPQEQQKVASEIKNFNETSNPFKDTAYDPNFVDPVGNAVGGFMPVIIGAIVIAVIVAIIVMLRSKRIKQAAARKKANVTKRNNELLLAESLAADNTAVQEELEEELATLKAELELKMKKVRQY